MPSLTYCHDAHFDESNRSRIAIVIAALIANLHLHAPLKELWKWVNIWPRSMKLGGLLFWITDCSDAGSLTLHRCRMYTWSDAVNSEVVGRCLAIFTSDTFVLERYFIFLRCVRVCACEWVFQRVPLTVQLWLYNAMADDVENYYYLVLYILLSSSSAVMGWR